ncbi:MAG: hypothetical protein F6K31_43245 [Symploca sp. SIO2G7]|nr:hypothetical protein [Symploca sp. SIO2G7]
MKNSFNNPLSNHDGALCNLCQDTLLRHISQSRVFWYCPSCRQETVCEEQAHRTAIAARLSQITPHRQLTKVTDHSQPVSIRA